MHTRVKMVTWEFTESGRLIPILTVDPPVELQFDDGKGCTHERITGVSAKAMMERGYGEGAGVDVRLDEGGFLRVINVIKRSEGIDSFRLPSACPSCGHATQVIGDSLCQNVLCPAKPRSAVHRLLSMVDASPRLTPDEIERYLDGVPMTSKSHATASNLYTFLEVFDNCRGLGTAGRYDLLASRFGVDLASKLFTAEVVLRQWLDRGVTPYEFWNAVGLSQLSSTLVQAHKQADMDNFQNSFMSRLADIGNKFVVNEVTRARHVWAPLLKMMNVRNK